MIEPNSIKVGPELLSHPSVKMLCLKHPPQHAASLARNDRRNGRSVIVMLCLFCTGLICLAPASAEDFGISRRNSAYSAAAVSAWQVSPSSTFQAPVLQSAENTPPSAVSASAAPKTGSQVLPSLGVSETAPTSSLPLANVVRLIAFDASGQSFGSGAYIGNYGEYGLILSNWHVVCESDGLVHIHFANGFSTYGAILAADKKWDLALIAISKPPQSVPLLPVARSLPRPGDPLWIAGYGAGTYRLAGGRCVRYLAPEIPQDGSSPLFEIIELSVSARQGDSGGPILNANNELAGVLFGSDMVRNTAGSGCERVNRFLSQAHSMLGSLPPKPENYFLSVEKDGPKRNLTESRTAVSTVSTAPKTEYSTRRSADFSGSSSQFGVRSGSRRYIQPTPNPPQQVQPRPVQPFQTAPQNSESPPPGAAPLPGMGTASSPVQNAVWNKTLASGGIRQTGHHVFADDRLFSGEKLVPLSHTKPDRSTSSRKWESVTVSERNDTVPRSVIFAATFFVAFLVGLAIPLLKNDSTPR